MSDKEQKLGAEPVYRLRGLVNAFLYRGKQ